MVWKNQNVNLLPGPCSYWRKLSKLFKEITFAVNQNQGQI